MIIGVDPGKLTGIFALNDEGEPLYFKELSLEELYEYLPESEGMDITWVVEDYKIRPPKFQKNQYSHIWTRPLSIEIIGIFRFWAFLQGQEVYISPPKNKPAGYGYANMKYVKGKSGPGIHHKDALSHAMYYLVEVKRGRPWGLPTKGSIVP